ncbi:MAG: DUF4258 domain-containing protein [Pseudomonadota bacterium]
MAKKEGIESITVIERIRQKIRERDYYLSGHAEEEMAEDGFGRSDMENAILQGHIEKKMTHDPRGTRYRIEGTARDGRVMHVLCRFREASSLIIITIYEREH